MNRSLTTLKALTLVTVLVFMSALSTDGWTQASSTGAIAGSVRDASGKAIAGATVKAESDALIEKTREVMTDDHGQYKLVDLRPGTYTVTFSFAGFATIKREGLELNTGTTLPVDAQMEVGSLAQTVTVTGATPVVDVENSNPENVLDLQKLQTAPTGGTIQGFASMTLGAVGSGAPDVGGSQNEANSTIIIHDSRSQNGDLLWDGMSFANGIGTGGQGQRAYLVNKVSIQQVTISTGATGADTLQSGASINYVPRQGGDSFHGSANYTQATSAWQAANLDSALVARGLTSNGKIKNVYDIGAGLGGPVFRGKLWFWGGFGDWAALTNVPGNYFNKTQNTLFYTPDLARPAYTSVWNYAYDVRLDWQASRKNKFTVFEGFIDRCTCYQGQGGSSNIAPEAAENDWNRASFLTQAAWVREQTSKLLFRVAFTSNLNPGRNQALSPGVKSTDVPIVEQDTGYGYHANIGFSSTSYGRPQYSAMNGVAYAMYVTGSHALKAGFQWTWNNENYDQKLNAAPGVGPVAYMFNQPTGAPAPVPVQITEYASPLDFTARSWVNAFYAQDQWTMHRLTLNLGVRYDLERGYALAQNKAASFFTPAQSFPAVSGIPDWNDIEPRVGASYDLFGNAKSAIKGAIGRYVLGDSVNTTVANTPANAIVTSATRAWTMTPAEITASGGNYVPNCDLSNVNANGKDPNNKTECGPLSNSAFGTVSANTGYDPSILSGWGVRPHNWEADIQFQQQIRPGVGIQAGYYRTWYGGFTATQNTLVPANGYDSYCITGPVDSRVSSLTGATVCGFHDVQPAYFGKVQNLVTSASKFGGQSEVYNGFDIGLNARFGHGGYVAGGYAGGQTTYDDCAVAKNYPNVTVSQTNAIGSVSGNTTTPTQFCHYTIPWMTGSQVKFNGGYPLPWGLETSFVYQNLPGVSFNTSYVATDAQVASSLGRVLSACGSKTVATCTTTVTLSNALYTPFSQHEARLNQLDLRFSKLVKIKERFQIKGNFDIYNIANSNTITSESAVYSTTNSYLRPTAILGGRMFKLGTNFNF